MPEQAASKIVTQVAARCSRGLALWHPRHGAVDGRGNTTRAAAGSTLHDVTPCVLLVACCLNPDDLWCVCEGKCVPTNESTGLNALGFLQMLQHQGCHLYSIVKIEFLHDVGEVISYRVIRQAQLRANHLVAQSLCNIFSNFNFA